MAINLSDYKTTKHHGIKLHKNGTTFLFDIRVNGKRYRKTFEANTNHTKADRLKSAYIASEQFRNDKLHADTIVADMDATVGDYWIKLKELKNWKSDIEKGYNYYYDKHLRELDKLKIKNVKPSHFTNLNISLKYLAPRTQKTAYEILRPLFNLAVEDEIISRNPIKKSHIPVRKGMEEKKIITDAETKYRAVYKAINDLFGAEQVIEIKKGTKVICHSNPHHKAIFLFGFHGRRIQEVLSLKWSDINFNTNTYIIRGENSKVNTDMTFDLPVDVRDALLEFQSSSGKVFNVKLVERYYSKIRLLTGIEEFTYHWMRNLSVSALSSMGIDLTHLTAMLGHTDSSTLKKYLSLQREVSTAVTNAASTKLLDG